MLRKNLHLRNVATAVACLAVTTLFTGCDKGNTPAFTEFSFAGQQGTAVIDKKNNTVTAVADNTVNLQAITPTFTLSPNGTTATVSGAAQISGTTVQNFSNPVKYSLKTTDGTVAEWTVTITSSGSSSGERIKAATIHYTDGSNDHYLCFDNYGKLFRYEVHSASSDVPGIFICDEVAGTCIAWGGPDNGWAPCPYPATAAAFRNLVLIDYNAGLKNVPTAYPSTTTKTFAGQLCYVYQVPSLGELALWGNTVFLEFVGGVNAVDARLGCPDNAFTQTVTISW